ncbi:hypothetical protein ACT6NV_07920 [Robiginitalea sp. IMCC44478]|uniref:hypothetical protein n=1 Tax=Robiginitalea sp. IMCC44478 TaxID=3459122 RepID=UPI004041C594
MKKIAIIIIFALFAGMSQVQAQTSMLQQGQVLKIDRPESGNFEYVKFPRKNFIIKRGGIADMKSVEGMLVVVQSFKETKWGTEVTLKRKDGRKFFRNFPTITAIWPDARDKGELHLVN